MRHRQQRQATFNKLNLCYDLTERNGENEPRNQGKLFLLQPAYAFSLQLEQEEQPGLLLQESI